MSMELTEVVWLDEQHEVSFTELAQLSGLSQAELSELVEYGVLMPNHPQVTPWTFGAHSVVEVRAVCRLRNDFDLDSHSLALALLFLNRIRELEAQLRNLRAQQPLL